MSDIGCERQDQPQLFDDLDRHLAAAGSFDRAALPMGLYLAWCANHQLLSRDLSERCAALIVRVRMRDASGSELAVAGCHGRLDGSHLNAEGCAFSARRYADFRALLESRYGAELYAEGDDWARYDEIAPQLTRWLREARGDSGDGEPPQRLPWQRNRTRAPRRGWKFWR